MTGAAGTTRRDPLRAVVVGVGAVVVALSLVRLALVRTIDHLPALVTIVTLVIVVQLAPMALRRRRDEQVRVVTTALLFALLFVWGLPIAVVPVVVFTMAWGARERAPWFARCYTVARSTLALVAARLVLLGSYGPVDLAHTRNGLDIADVPWLASAAVVYAVTDTALTALGPTGRRQLLPRAARAARTRAPVLLSTVALAPVVVVVAFASWYLLPALMVPVLLLYYTAASAQGREAAALRDELTGLPNRSALLRRLEESVTRWRERDVPFAVLLIELDDIDRINDTLGHAAGERVIAQFTRTVQDTIGGSDFLARPGGDEWAVIAGGVDGAGARELAERMREAVAAPIDIDGISMATTASIGIALCPQHGQEPAALLRRADVARHLARHTGIHAEIYSAERDPNSTDRLRLLAELREAISGEAIELYHQPKISAASGTPIGVEALARWRHPTRGFVPPEEFVSLAEGTDVIRLLTARVIDLAIEQATSWHGLGLAVPVAVNVSPSDLADIALVTRVADALARHALPPHLLCLEITERVVVRDVPTVRRHVSALRRLGVRISLDDFGTEYSTLLRLQSLPVDEIKIDRAFVERLGGTNDTGIVAAVVTLAHSLGLTVVAEGVETLEQLEVLRSYHCDAIQGHLVARPMPTDEATTWLRDHLPPPASAQRPALRTV